MIEIKQIEYGSDFYTQTLILRDEVLRKALGLNILDDNIAAEKDQIHLALFFNGQISSCLLVKFLNDTEAQIRQVCTMPVYHGYGFGSALMLEAEHLVKVTQRRKIVLHARKNAVEFYLHRGYKIVGDEFIEIGIPHIKMEKIILEN